MLPCKTSFKHYVNDVLFKLKVLSTLRIPVSLDRRLSSTRRGSARELKSRLLGKGAWLTMFIPQMNLVTGRWG